MSIHYSLHSLSVCGPLFLNGLYYCLVCPKRKACQLLLLYYAFYTCTVYGHQVLFVCIHYDRITGKGNLEN